MAARQIALRQWIRGALHAMGARAPDGGFPGVVFAGGPVPPDVQSRLAGRLREEAAARRDRGQAAAANVARRNQEAEDAAVTPGPGVEGVWQLGAAVRRWRETGTLDLRPGGRRGDLDDWLDGVAAGQVSPAPWIRAALGVLGIRWQPGDEGRPYPPAAEVSAAAQSLAAAAERAVTGWRERAADDGQPDGEQGGEPGTAAEVTAARGRAGLRQAGTGRPCPARARLLAAGRSTGAPSGRALPAPASRDWWQLVTDDWHQRSADGSGTRPAALAPIDAALEAGAAQPGTPGAVQGVLDAIAAVPDPPGGRPGELIGQTAGSDGTRTGRLRPAGAHIAALVAGDHR